MIAIDVRRWPEAWTALGACVGAAAAAAVAPLTRGCFHVPTGGVGIVTVTGYPKAYDYAVVALLIVGSAAGAFAGSRWSGGLQPAGGLKATAPRSFSWIAAVIVFVLMLFIHDHPYALLEPFHEGEHLTPGFLFRNGVRPYGDVFVLRGLGVDGGLDALVLGDPPSPRRVRRLQTLLDAATLALLVPIAAELSTTAVGAAAAAFVGLCMIAAGQIPLFPWFRLAPLLLAALGMLRYARSRNVSSLALALAASTLGVLWSLDTGLYALAATVIVCFLLRARIALPIAAVALLLPFALLLVVHADIHRFLVDSFLIIPRSIDAIWSRPALREISWESARYYLPPVFFGWMLVAAWRRGDRRIAIVAIFSIIAFRTAAGRCSWSHTRYGLPLFGVAAVTFALEPLLLARRRFAAAILAIALFVFVEVAPNVAAASRFLVGWRARQSHSGLVPYPVATGRGIYTTRENAADLAGLNGFLDAAAPPGAPILDVSNERALYYLLQRRPPTRCFDVAMLSAPPLLAEAMRQLEANPPACVVVEGMKELDQYDGVPNRIRAPALFAWIDARYPRRARVGRYLVATR